MKRLRLIFVVSLICLGILSCENLDHYTFKFCTLRSRIYVPLLISGENGGYYDSYADASSAWQSATGKNDDSFTIDKDYFCHVLLAPSQVFYVPKGAEASRSIVTALDTLRARIQQGSDVFDPTKSVTYGGADKGGLQGNYIVKGMDNTERANFDWEKSEFWYYREDAEKSFDLRPFLVADSSSSASYGVLGDACRNLGLDVSDYGEVNCVDFLTMFGAENAPSVFLSSSSIDTGSIYNFVLTYKPN